MQKIIQELKEANQALVFQCEEKEKCAAELVIANEELVFQNGEKEKRAAELVIANKELLFQNEEKEKHAAELILANQKLEKSEAELKEYITGLKEMMFVTSHKVRKPVANILGICSQLEGASISSAELSDWVKQMKQSAVMLDAFTKELTSLMTDLGHKADVKSSGG
jgi:light-regulated signal transduction histidine kinase (bacteriophytochrome)